MIHQGSIDFIETVNQQQLSVILNISPSEIRKLDQKNILAKIDRGMYDLPLSIQGYVNYWIEKTKEVYKGKSNELNEN